MRHQFGRQAADRLAAERAFEHRVRPARQVDRDLRLRLRPSAAGSRSGAMPRLSPSASRSAWPSASAQSSTVWCSSTSRSPWQVSSSAKPPWRATCSSMWSKKPMPVEIATGAGAVEMRRSLSICGFPGAARRRCAVRSRPAQPRRDRGPGRAPSAPSSPHAQSLDAEIGGELHVGVAVADHVAVPRVRLRGARGTRSSSPVRGLRQSQPSSREVRAEELGVERDALRGEQLAQEVLRLAEVRLRERCACRARPGC